MDKVHFMNIEKGLINHALQLGGPVFVPAVVLVPLMGMMYAVFVSGSLLVLNYVHVMSAILWTGFDLFMGFVLGPILGKLPQKDRAAVFKRLIPKITFLLPVLAVVTTITGFELVKSMGYSFDSIWSYPWIVAGIVIATILGMQAVFFLIPNEVRIFQQLLRQNPDIQTINRLGMINTRLAGLQGIMQISIVFVMANIRF